MQLSASLNPYLRETFLFNVTVLPYPNLGAPKFLGNFPRPLIVKVGTTLIYSFPPTKDSQNDPTRIDLDPTTLPGFVKYNFAQSQV